MFFGGAFIGGFIAWMLWYEDMDVSIVVKIVGVISVIGIILTITYRKYFYIMKQQPIEIEKEKIEQNN